MKRSCNKVGIQNEMNFRSDMKLGPIFDPPDKLKICDSIYFCQKIEPTLDCIHKVASKTVPDARDQTFGKLSKNLVYQV